MNKKRVLFIINPFSGISRQKNIEKLVLEKLDLSRFEYKFEYTNCAKHATEIAKQASANFDIIVAVGGDGTINEVGLGLMNTKCVLAIIPTGSGNGLARCLKIPLQITKALELINDGKVKTIDIVSCNGYVFVNIAGVGFDAEVGHLFANHVKRGFWKYLKIVLSEFRSYQPKLYTVEIDGINRTFDAFLISIANSNQYGNNIKIAPQASLNDGYVDVCVLRKFPLYATPLLAWQLMMGKLQKSNYLEIYKTKSLSITTGESAIKAHLDGEPFMIPTAMKINVIPASLKVLVPQKTTV